MFVVETDKQNGVEPTNYLSSKTNLPDSSAATTSLMDISVNVFYSQLMLIGLIVVQWISAVMVVIYPELFGHEVDAPISSQLSAPLSLFGGRPAYGTRFTFSNVSERFHLLSRSCGWGN